MRPFSCLFVVLAVVISAPDACAQVSAPYSENFDAGVPAGWTLDPLTFGVGWDVDYDGAPCDPVGLGKFPHVPGVDGPRVGSSGGSLNYNNGTDYVATDPMLGPVAHKGTALSPVIDVSVLGGSVIVSWQNNFETEDYSSGDTGFDVMTFSLTDASGTTIPGTLFKIGDKTFDPLLGLDAGIMGTRKLMTIDCSAAIAAAGVSSIRVSFNFASVDGAFDTFNGWFIDDLQVSCGTPDLSAPSPTPTLLTPPDASLVTSPVILDWSDSTDTSPCGPSTPSYDVFLDTVNPPVTFAGNTAVSTFTTGILAPGTYYWQVLARDGSGNTTPLSAVFSFDVEAPLPPLAPDSLFVNEDFDGAQNGDAGFVDPVLDQSPVFSAIYRDANSSDSALTLRFQISQDPAFAVLDFDSGTIALPSPLPKDSRSPDLTIGFDLGRDTVYFWRIRFTDAAGLTGAFSAAQSFHIGDDFQFGGREGSTHHGRRCYVATAAMGSGSPVVARLSGFRRATLERSGAGSVFSRAYATLGAVLAGAPSLVAALLGLACLAFAGGTVRLRR